MAKIAVVYWSGSGNTEAMLKKLPHSVMAICTKRATLMQTWLPITMRSLSAVLPWG